MKMNWMFRTSIPAVTLVLLLCAGAGAQEQDKPATSTELKQIQVGLDEVMAELKAVRGDLNKVMVDVKAIKASQGRPKRQQRRPDTTVYNIDIGDSPIRGPKDAPVTIVEYVCYQCPFCVREEPVIKKVMDAYPDKVRRVFKHYPLAMHKKAKPAHAAAALAQKQKGTEGFWQMHDLIITDSRKIDISTLRGYAETVGLDLNEFDEVLGDPAKMDELLQKDLTEAKNYRVTGTPAVFINGLRLTPRKFEGYKARIDELLKGQAAPNIETMRIKPKIEVRRVEPTAPPANEPQE